MDRNRVYWEGTIRANAGNLLNHTVAIIPAAYRPDTGGEQRYLLPGSNTGSVYQVTFFWALGHINVNHWSGPTSPRINVGGVSYRID